MFANKLNEHLGSTFVKYILTKQTLNSVMAFIQFTMFANKLNEHLGNTFAK